MSLDTSRLAQLSSRRVRALAAQVRRERLRIQEQAVVRGSSIALGERLSGVEAMERACQRELASRRPWWRLRRRSGEVSGSR